MKFNQTSAEHIKKKEKLTSIHTSGDPKELNPLVSTMTQKYLHHSILVYESIIYNHELSKKIEEIRIIIIVVG